MYRIGLLCFLTVMIFSCHRNVNLVFQKDVFKTISGKKVSIKCYHHASLAIEYDGCIIQIDPVVDNSRGIDYKREGKADYIFITHEHFDHFDPKAIEQLSKASTNIILTNNCRKKLGKGSVILNGTSMLLTSNINVKAVPAYNTTVDRLKYHPRYCNNGYIFKIENIHIYIAGDTEVIPEMGKLGPIDIAFLPCNQPYTMTFNQLVEAARIIRPKILYPYHYSETDVSKLPEILKQYGIRVLIRNMQ